MLDKSAFEKALQQDKAKVSNFAPQAQQNNIQFNNQNRQVGKVPGAAKREQLWEEKKKQRANKINPTVPVPGPVVRNGVFGNNQNSVAFPTAQAPVRANRFQNQQNIDFNQQDEVPEFHPVPQMEETPSSSNEIEMFQRENPSPKQNFFNPAMDNAPISAPSGYQAQPSYPRNDSGGRQNINFEQPQDDGGFAIGAQDQQNKNKGYLNDWKKEIEERELRKKREKEEEKRKEREEMEKYNNPFGRGGAGAPIRDTEGKIVTQRKPGPQQNMQQVPNTMNQQYNYNPPQAQQPRASIQYQPPVQQRMPDPNGYNQQFQGPYGAAPMQYAGDFQMENPYEFQPPVAPHGQNGFNHNFPAYNPRGMTPPVQQNPRMYGGAGPYGNQFGMAGGGNAYGQMPEPLPQHHAANQSVEVDPRSDRGMQNAGRRLMTPSRGEAAALQVGANEDMLVGRKKQIKNEWQRELLEQMEEKKRRKEEEKRKRDMEEMEEERRIQREREQMEMEFKKEQDKKKKEVEDMQKANEALMEAHRRKNEPKKAPGKVE